MNTTFKTNTLVMGQGASDTQEGHAPKPNNASFLTQADVITLLQRELYKFLFLVGYHTKYESCRYTV